MSTGSYAEVIGDGLYIPRIQVESRLSEPPFDGMGALVGPGQTPDTLSIVVAARNRGQTFLLDHDYKPVTPGLFGLHLEEGNLLAHQLRRKARNPRRTSYRDQWPLKIGYEIPSWNPLASKTFLTELHFDSLQPFFDAERKRYDADRTVKELGIAVYGMMIWAEHHFDRQPCNRFAEYHDGAVIVAATKLGQIAVAPVGQLGAMRYLLNASGKRLSRGHHGFIVEAGKIRGEINSKPSRLTGTKLGSRHIPKAPITTAA